MQNDISLTATMGTALELAAGIEDEDTSLAGPIIEPFDPNEVRIESAQITIDLLLKRIEHGEIDLAPDFQRKAGIWNDRTQSRLIESLLVRIPLPAFYFDATDDNRWLVVDGLQRLTTLKRYILDAELKLTDLEFLKMFEGKRFDELPRPFQRRITESQITAFRIQQGTPDNVKFTVFRRINTGGLPLSAQEIRHALNQGRAPQFLTELAKAPAFLRATDYSIRDDRMQDRECVLRFIAFSLTDYRRYKALDFDAFLSDAMGRLNTLPEDDLLALRNKFYAALDTCHELFGRYAFRKINDSGFRSPINKAIFEAWTVDVGALDSIQQSKLVKNNAQLMEKWRFLLEDPTFSEAISVGTGNPLRVRKRFSDVAEIIEECL